MLACRTPELAEQQHDLSVADALQARLPGVAANAGKSIGIWQALGRCALHGPLSRVREVYRAAGAGLPGQWLHRVFT